MIEIDPNLEQRLLEQVRLQCDGDFDQRLDTLSKKNMLLLTTE